MSVHGVSMLVTIETHTKIKGSIVTMGLHPAGRGQGDKLKHLYELTTNVEYDQLEIIVIDLTCLSYTRACT